MSSQLQRRRTAEARATIRSLPHLPQRPRTRSKSTLHRRRGLDRAAAGFRGDAAAESRADGGVRGEERRVWYVAGVCEADMAVSRTFVNRDEDELKLDLQRVRSSRRPHPNWQSVRPACLRERFLGRRSTGYTTYSTTHVKCHLTSTPPPSPFPPHAVHAQPNSTQHSHPSISNQSINQSYNSFIFIFVVCIAIVSYRHQHSPPFPLPLSSPSLTLRSAISHTIPLHRLHRLQTLTPPPRSSKRRKRKEKKQSRFKSKRSKRWG
jgi:hypothetical protein